MSERRTYRHWVEDSHLFSFNVTIEETDLYIRAEANLKRMARRLVTKYRTILETYIEQHPAFLTSLKPVPVADTVPQIVAAMARAAQAVNVGPMAAVAGAIAEFVGRELVPFSPEIIVENGGDIYLRSSQERVIGIYAGKSPFTGRLGLVIRGESTPLGICTSSGTVGHSLSYGRTDAVIAVSPSAVLADAAATAIGNLIVQPADIPPGIEMAKGIEGLSGVIIIQDDQIGLWGDINLCETNGSKGVG